MKEIRAFVGHSFTEADEAVVAKFLKYFDQLARSHAGFSWTHAEAAEPKVLADKVRGLISEANLFVGICTKKERAVEPNGLREAKLRSGVLWAYERDFAWKTSDWIIQEIGLAIGKGLDLLLLVEKGLRPPGGLQGNVEYIEFERETPGQAFGKILEMLSALAPKSTTTAAGTTGTEAKSDDDSAAKPSTDWLVPGPDWKRSNYELAFFHRTVTGDAARAQEISASYLETEQAADPEQQRSWDEYVEYTKIVYGGGGSLATLKAYAEANSDNGESLWHYAAGLAEFGEHGEAARMYEAAALRSPETKEKMRLLGRAVSSFAQAGMESERLAALREMKAALAATHDGLSEFLHALREMAEITKDDSTAIAAMERIIELNPGDSYTRFNLAYKYSHTGHEDLAFFHYKRIPPDQRTSMTWNNLGVAYAQLSMPAKAVAAFRKSEAMGESLAMSNLAERLIRAGFLREARELCDRALAIPNYPKNVTDVLAHLQEVEGRENGEEESASESVRKKAEFYRALGHAIVEDELADIPHQWQAQECVVKAEADGNKFRATGLYEEKATLSTLAGLLGQPQTKTHKLEYVGTVRGKVVVGQVSRLPQDGSPPATLLAVPNETQVLMIVDLGSGVIRVLENPQSKTPKFYNLTKA